MLYAVGSLLFALATMASITVIMSNIIHYRAQMVAALRTLSVDGIYGQPKPTPAQGASWSQLRDRQALAA